MWRFRVNVTSEERIRGFYLVILCITELTDAYGKTQTNSLHVQQVIQPHTGRCTKTEFNGWCTGDRGVCVEFQFQKGTLESALRKSKAPHTFIRQTTAQWISQNRLTICCNVAVFTGKHALMCSFITDSAYFGFKARVLFLLFWIHLLLMASFF